MFKSLISFKPCFLEMIFSACVGCKCVPKLKSLQAVEVCVPYHRKKKKEVVVRRFDGETWSILPTDLRRGSVGHASHPGGRPARVKLFQMIAVQLESIPVENSIKTNKKKLASKF